MLPEQWAAAMVPGVELPVKFVARLERLAVPGVPEAMWPFGLALAFEAAVAQKVALPR